MTENYAARSRWFAVSMLASFVAICYVLFRGLSPIGALVCGFGIVVFSYNCATALATGLAAALIRRRMFSDIAYHPNQNMECGVVVCVPCLLSEKSVIDQLLTTVERNANTFNTPTATFVLLADYVDTLTVNYETEASDAKLLQVASDGISRLNNHYGAGRFSLLVRSRVWCEAEGRWMGWERKRGKVEALMRLMVTGDQSAFDVVDCETARLRQSEFLCVLDADAYLTAGCIEHLVQVARSPQGRRFHILQPGLLPLESEPVNLYQWITVNPFPPLSIWQDIFGRSKFVGKGLYRVKEVSELFANRVPTSWVLSHDVMESTIAHTGSVDRVYLRESSPRTYAENLRRLERWYRGDWQNMPWALPQLARYCIREFSGLQKISVKPSSAWMVADLLLRDLHPPALLVLISLSLFETTSTFFLVLIFVFEFITAFMTLLSKLLRGEAPPSPVEALRTTLFVVFSLAALPSQAWTAARSMCVALIRMFVTRRNRLEWVASRELSAKGVSNWTHIWPQLIFGTALIIIGLFEHRVTAISFGALFLCCPLMTYFMESRSFLQVKS